MLAVVLSTGVGGLGMSTPASAAGAGALTLAPKKNEFRPKSSKARKHFDTAVKLYKDNDFEGASEAAAKGLAIEEHESLLFIGAQAERQRGNCVEAVDLLNRFLAVTEDENMKENALTAKSYCAEELAEQARQAELEAQLEADIEEDPDPDPEPEAPPPPPPPPWYRDPLGGALVGVGGAMVLTGAALLIVGARITQVQAPDYGTHDRRLVLQPKLLLAGGIVGGAGLLVAGGGGLRWGLVARKNKKAAAAAKESARVQIAPWWSPTDGGVVLSGRF